MKIYLAGSIPKGDKEAATFEDWRIRYREEIQKHFDAEYIDPYDREVDESDFLYVFGKDCLQIRNADLIVVYAEKQLGVGTSQELLIAKIFKKPVVVVLPKDSYHRRTNVTFRDQNVEDWIHPFIYACADVILEDIKSIKDIQEKLQRVPVKDLSIIEEAMNKASIGQ